jgi:hypothetical protein
MEGWESREGRGGRGGVGWEGRGSEGRIKEVRRGMLKDHAIVIIFAIRSPLSFCSTIIKGE